VRKQFLIPANGKNMGEGNRIPAIFPYKHLLMKRTLPLPPMPPISLLTIITKNTPPILQQQQQHNRMNKGVQQATTVLRSFNKAAKNARAKGVIISKKAYDRQKRHYSDLVLYHLRRRYISIMLGFDTIDDPFLNMDVFENICLMDFSVSAIFLDGYTFLKHDPNRNLSTQAPSMILALMFDSPTHDYFTFFEDNNHMDLKFKPIFIDDTRTNTHKNTDDDDDDNNDNNNNNNNNTLDYIKSSNGNKIPDEFLIIHRQGIDMVVRLENPLLIRLSLVSKAFNAKFRYSSEFMQTYRSTILQKSSHWIEKMLDSRTEWDKMANFSGPLFRFNIRDRR
jgi:hypothetical protein